MFQKLTVGYTLMSMTLKVGWKQITAQLVLRKLLHCLSKGNENIEEIDVDNDEQPGVTSHTEAVS